ncbi:MAG: ribosomal protein [Betaproteobacteria bacterium]|nr:ribosomal protein [Betaproteobacteria bacterium]
MKIEVIASTRKLQGTGASRRLRRANKVPGVIYGGEKQPQSIEIDHNPLFHAMRKEAFHASILEMTLDGAAEQVLLRDYVMHPFKQQIQHIDFQRVDAKKDIHIRVPLHFLNAAESQAVKFGGAMVSHVANDIEIACLPKDLPEFIEVDLKDIAAGHSVHVADLKLPAGVRAVLHGKENPVVATAVVRGKEEEVVAEAAAPTAADVPATAQKKPADAAAAPAKDAKGGDKKDKK